jgi:hypothetical protein
MTKVRVKKRFWLFVLPCNLYPFNSYNPNRVALLSTCTPIYSTCTYY